MTISRQSWSTPKRWAGRNIDQDCHALALTVSDADNVASKYIHTGSTDIVLRTTVIQYI